MLFKEFRKITEIRNTDRLSDLSDAHVGRIKVAQGGLDALFADIRSQRLADFFLNAFDR